MDNLSSDSSDSDRDDSEVLEKTTQDLTLNEVNDMVREYEKMEKRERKVRKDSYAAKETVIMSPEQLAQITLTKKQLRQIEAKDKKERTEKQKEATRKLLDLRKAQAEQAIIAKAPVKRKTPRPKVVTVQEEEEEEPVEPQRIKSFQAKKPALEEDEMEQKVEKLTKLNNVLSSNPYYAQVMASRGVKF